MSVSLGYMGTKRETAGLIATIMRDRSSGPLLDLFSGMSAVAQEVSSQRPVWVNDVQLFPSRVGKALFTRRLANLRLPQVRPILNPLIEVNKRSLIKRFSKELLLEKTRLRAPSIENLKGEDDLPWVGTSEELESERSRLQENWTAFPFRMAAITYCGSFFGMSQCIEIDSIRFGIYAAASAKKIDHTQESWLLVALCCAAARVNNSTGHFAHYLRPKASNLSRVIRQRRRSPTNEFWCLVDDLRPVGSPLYRSKNRAFHLEARSLLRRLTTAGTPPAVIYADPPYSKAQYSRYYHVLDELIAYRYPRTVGVGRYPARRFQTPFSQTTAVNGAMNELVTLSATLGAPLLLSYPSNGLYCRSGNDVRSLLESAYRKVSMEHEVLRLHSTFGGVKGVARREVTEQIYLGVEPR